MEINFNNDKKSQSSDAVETFDGTFEDLVNKRKQEMPRIEKAINDILKNYSGGMVAVISIEEDENGMPSCSNSLVTGAAGVPSSLRMVEALEGCTERLKEKIYEGSTKDGDPRHMLELLSEMLKSIKDKE